MHVLHAKNEEIIIINYDKTKFRNGEDFNDLLRSDCCNFFMH